MKPLLLSLVMILLSIGFITTAPSLIGYWEEKLADSKVPVNNAKIAGIQKYNRPPINLGTSPPTLSARSVLVEDLTTDTMLYQKDANLRLPIASTTKIMTALVASGFFQPSDILTVNEAVAAPGVKIGLTKGESLNFRSLLYAMLLNSGNDAAYAIAENYPQGTEAFVSAMNEKVLELNLANTHFTNPAGFDSPKHFSSAVDLAVITQASLKDGQLVRIFATKETEVLSTDRKYRHQLHNLNKLLSQVRGVLGVKTGYTQEAKENLVTLVERDGHKILTVVLGSDNRFGESEKLIEWVYANFAWVD